MGARSSDLSQLSGTRSLKGRGLCALLGLSMLACALLPEAVHAQGSACPPGFSYTAELGCRFVVLSVPPPLGDAALGDEAVPEPFGGLSFESDETGISRQITLDEFIRDPVAAKALGKALFWDIQVGSDGGTACATCHHHAGADGRISDSMHPGTDGIFGGAQNGSRRSVLPGEDFNGQSFPTSSLGISLDRFDRQLQQGIAPYFSPSLRNIDDIVGSAGVIQRDFAAIFPTEAGDSGMDISDPVFNASGANTRQVTNRNAPSTINASFYTRQFWDGRASEIFNGVDPLGPVNAGARIWVSTSASVQAARLELHNSSLASQALWAPNHHVAMAFGRSLPDGRRANARGFKELARKLLSLRPLARQKISITDSLLGRLRHPSGKGLQVGYRELIQKAFEEAYWDESAVTDEGFPLMEGNFSLFWGLALQMYQGELVSSADHTRFDRFVADERHRNGNMHANARSFIAQSKSDELSAKEKLGMRVFFNDGLSDPAIGKGMCAACHVGSAFSIATYSGRRSVRRKEAGPKASSAYVAETSVSSMLPRERDNMTVATFAERPDVLPDRALPMNCSTFSGDSEELCAAEFVWPLRGGWLNRDFEIRQESSGNIIFKGTSPADEPACGESAFVTFGPTTDSPAPLSVPGFQPELPVATGTYTDIFDPIKGTCTNAQLELRLRGVPAGDYSLLIDGIEQTRLDGSPLFTIIEPSRYDLGFYNIGVRPTQEDLGIGGRHPSAFSLDELGEPISYARRLQEGFDVPELEGLQSVAGLDDEGNAWELVTPEVHVIDAGAFKVPTLRNVALTAPYFHTGSMLDLDQVLAFYNRGGDFHEVNLPDLAPGIGRLGLTANERSAVVAFLHTLTDERVLQEQAPFDHPSLPLPGRGELKAVGSGGRAAECLPVLQSLSDRFRRRPEVVVPILDCNENGVADGCDIECGDSLDEDSNGIPDECLQAPACFDGIDQDSDGLVDMQDSECRDPREESEGKGWCDMDFSGKVDIEDLDFILDRSGERSEGPSDRFDRNGDGRIDLADAIECFIRCDDLGCYPRSHRCGLIGLEALLGLIPLARKRRRPSQRGNAGEL